MPFKKPNIDGLLALLERFFAPKQGTLPGGTATVAELDFAEKESPIKGEDVKPGPWPGLTSPDSAENNSASVAGAGPSSPRPPSSSSAPPTRRG
ncbi:benzoate 4-monooxygenase cytochrome p450 [Fusarium longipes]|uniref:Benzoate 4-monooxygenase cytochrome p450 n=1 Tax=Fusarium longipes TaxID=694270 RepID=A0A395S8M3_9HYPO|nr:benzoate 4-monooxygenase cytochrome p450 [Fusarium longipes]